MKTKDSLLELLCEGRFKKQVADLILSRLMTSGDCQSDSFWKSVHSELINCTRGVGFECYKEIAQCHKLCVACTPDNGALWNRIVFEELMKRLAQDPSLNAYVMGTYLGMFQAGVYLQDGGQLLQGGFLRNVARYCVRLLDEKSRSINATSDYTEESAANKVLDETIKQYLRTTDPNLSVLIKAELITFLEELSRSADIVVKAISSPSPFAACDRQIQMLNSILHAALNINNRNISELMILTRTALE